METVLIKRLKALKKKWIEDADWGWDAGVLIVAIRFSVSFVNDVLWYLSLTRRVTATILLTIILWAVWIFLPILKSE